MLHILATGASPSKIVQASKGHLQLMMGEILRRVQAGQPIYSFESTDVDTEMVRQLVVDLEAAGAALRFQAEHRGECEEITRQHFINRLERGNEIRRQVDRDIARELGDEE